MHKNFLEYLRALHPAQKERWVWGLSAAGIALVLLLGWASLGILLPRDGETTSAREATTGDVPFFEAVRGGVASVVYIAGRGLRSLKEFFFSPRVYPITPTP